MTTKTTNVFFFYGVENDVVGVLVMLFKLFDITFGHSLKLA